MNKRIEKPANEIHMTGVERDHVIRDHMREHGLIAHNAEAAKRIRQAKRLHLTPFINLSGSPVFGQGELTVRQICADHDLVVARVVRMLEVAR